MNHGTDGVCRSESEPETEREAARFVWIVEPEGRRLCSALQSRDWSVPLTSDVGVIVVNVNKEETEREKLAAGRSAAPMRIHLQSSRTFERHIPSASASGDMDACRLMKELRVNREQEGHYLPRETGLALIQSTAQDDRRISGKCRDAKVEDLWSLTSFFGYSTQTFVLAVNLLDRFLAMMRIQRKHLSCVSLSCLHMATKATEEECNLTPSDELIRIGQCRFTVSDLGRMEKIVAEKLHFKSKAITAFTFLQLYHRIALLHASDRTLSLEKLEAQLKACLCRISFSKAKPSVLALSLLRQEIEGIRSADMLEIARHVQRRLKIADDELLLWRGQVARRLSDYASPECSRPDHRKLQWIVSRRTAQTLHASLSVPELPTIPEARRDDDSEDSCVDVSSGEESLSSSLGSDAEGTFFPMHLRSQGPRRYLHAGEAPPLSL